MPDSYDRRTAALSPAVRAVQGQYQDKFNRIARLAEQLAEELVSEQKNISGNLDLDPLTLKVFDKGKLEKLVADMAFVANGATTLAKNLKSGVAFRR